MKVVFTGGGTGGHFYPIIAVAAELNRQIREEKLVSPKLYYLADRPYDKDALFEQGIEFKKISAGKWRRYFSLKNFIDLVKSFFGFLTALRHLYFIYPDVVFSKGGYVSYPVVWAARTLRIPVFIHESDSRPGRTNLWAGKFAARVAVAYPEAKEFFPDAKTAITGNPMREQIMRPISRGAYEFLDLQEGVPVVLVLGGSLGAVAINDVLIDILPELLKEAQVIHQTGETNLESVKGRASVVLQGHKESGRHHVFPFLNASALQMAAGSATVIITRAGSTLFEIAAWGVPAIVVPIPEEVAHDQRTNAYTYARSGGAVVIEQNNLSPSILLSELRRIISNPELQKQMREGARSFAKPEAAKLIAREIINIALEHEN